MRPTTTSTIAKGWQAAEQRFAKPACVVVFGRTERNDHIPALGLLS